MAGDWIKMRMDLQDDPAVIAMSAALDMDEYAIIGRLHKLWSWADRHLSGIGHTKSVTQKWIDRHLSCDGFAAAMQNAGWLNFDHGGVTFPNFDRHNGEGAKTRAEATERKRLSRLGQQNVPPVSQESRDGSVTREEKRRVNTNTPIPPVGGKAPASKKPKAAVALKTYLDECKAEGCKPIPENDPVFDYAADAKISQDVLWLHWREFAVRYSAPGAKRYKDWRSVFNKSVRGNWFRLWYFGADGECALTTAGIQAQNIHKPRAA